MESLLDQCLEWFLGRFGDCSLGTAGQGGRPWPDCARLHWLSPVARHETPEACWRRGPQRLLGAVPQSARARLPRLRHCALSHWRLCPDAQVAGCLSSERAKHASPVEDDVHEGTRWHCELHHALLGAGSFGKQVATAELNDQACRPVGVWACTINQMCHGTLQAHGAATQEV